MDCHDVDLVVIGAGERLTACFLPLKTVHLLISVVH